MSARLGPLEIECDSPPYAVVQATRRVGLCRPEDVRWIRLRHFLGHPPRGRGLLSLDGLKSLLGLGRKVQACPCGQPLPALGHYAFTYNTGTEASYLVGQCECCRTIFWEEP